MVDVLACHGSCLRRGFPQIGSDPKRCSIFSGAAADIGPRVRQVPRADGVHRLLHDICPLRAHTEAGPVQISNWQCRLDCGGVGADCMANNWGHGAHLRWNVLVHVALRACRCERLLRILLRRHLGEEIYQSTPLVAVAKQDLGGLHWRLLLHLGVGMVFLTLDLRVGLACVSSATSSTGALWHPSLPACISVRGARHRGTL
mmetsp:Transcript_12592/g.23253  ORF Transcript_12592/g.23253 Transcript_12592/m.23253 type:complete len:202 (+) Transcript_12592:466-1071(+)